MIRRLLAAGLALLGCASAGVPANARTILFVGNSFTFAALSPVQHFHPDRVQDLNGDGVGGVPALFATFAAERHLNWQVSLETSSGKPLSWHLANKAAVFGRRWDVVVLQGYSTLDPDLPGDPATHIAAASRLADLVRRANPAAQIDLVSTWPRADQVLQPSGHWYGQSLARMAADLAAANQMALTTSSALHAVLPVGAAWMNAIDEGVADPNPYDGLTPGEIDLWAPDHYHASSAGYYLEALIDFGGVTGTDPRALGAAEQAAAELGLPPALASRLQAIAARTLAAQQGGRLAAQAATPAP